MTAFMWKHLVQFCILHKFFISLTDVLLLITHNW